jgi:hypothetical protein
MKRIFKIQLYNKSYNFIKKFIKIKINKTDLICTINRKTKLLTIATTKTRKIYYKYFTGFKKKEDINL